MKREGLFHPTPETPAEPVLDGRRWLSTIEHINAVFEHGHGPAKNGEKEQVAHEVKTIREYVEYNNFRVTTATLAEIVNYFEDEAADMPDRQTVEKIKSLLLDSIKNIQHEIENYYNILLSIDRLYTIHKERMEPEEYRETSSQRDSRRRIIHDALIAELRIFTRICSVQIPNKLGITIPAEKLFTGPELSNRNFIGRWAFDMEFHRRVTDILEGELE